MYFYRPLLFDGFRDESSCEIILKKYSEKLPKCDAEGHFMLECYPYGGSWARGHSVHPNVRVVLRDDHGGKLGFYGEISWKELIFNFDQVLKNWLAWE